MTHIGTGAFGTVQREMRWGVPVAVKYAPDVAHEMGILRTVGSHPHVVAVLGFELGAIVLELGRTTLHSVLVDSAYAWSKAHVRTVFSALLDAVAYMHTRCVSHLDLKAENVVMRTETDPMLIDFGLAHHFTDPKVRTLDRYSGSRQYAAPEILAQRGPYDAYAADVWSLGVLLFAMLTKRLPVTWAHESDGGFVFARTKQRLGMRPVDSYFGFYNQCADKVLLPDECDVLDLMLSIDARTDALILCDYVPYCTHTS